LKIDSWLIVHTPHSRGRLALALPENPTTAGYLISDKVVHPRAFDIGVAVQVEDGVVLPVVRKVDQKPLRELIAEYDDLVDRARRRRLSEDDFSGGIATVTNFGTFGLTMGTPIPLPNETLILGIGAGVKKPVWSSEVEVFLPATVAEISSLSITAWSMAAARACCSSGSRKSCRIPPHFKSKPILSGISAYPECFSCLFGFFFGRHEDRHH
jgi:pyruvate/2-oxoglutarate dehydrogenase complex dihydrolipoamide acyltransferase (E2) component